MSRKIATLIGTGIIGGGAAVNPLLTGLIDYWKLDETSGNRLDSVGTRHMEPQQTVGNAVGKIGNCATASGTGNCLITAADASLTAIDWSLGFSVVGWVYVPTAFSGRNTILSKASDFSLYSNAQTQHRMYIYDSVTGVTNASLAQNTTNMTTDAWHFMAGRYNPSTKKAEVRVDGSAWSLGAALVNSPKNAITRLYIANYIDLYGNAYYDEVGLWTRYLSDAEVDSLYNGGAGKTYPF